MIGYYVHHHGLGHLHRAQVFARAWSELAGGTVTGLSSLTRPVGWNGPWVYLPRDDRSIHPVDPTAHERLHWAPLGDPGVRARAGLLSTWIQDTHPRAVVVDTSAEATIMIRLHGVPVVSVVLPGWRSDAASVTGYRLSDALVATWPQEAEHGGLDVMNPGLPQDIRERVVCVGAVSRFSARGQTNSSSPADVPGSAPAAHLPRVVIIGSRPSDMLSGTVASDVAARVPGWDPVVLSAEGHWAGDPWHVLASADVVVTNAGQSALGDLSALRKPAVVVPDYRPHAEQEIACRVLEAGPWPVVVRATAADALSLEAIEGARKLDGDLWSAWCDGLGARRMAEIVDTVRLARR